MLQEALTEHKTGRGGPSSKARRESRQGLLRRSIHDLSSVMWYASFIKYYIISYRMYKQYILGITYYVSYNMIRYITYYTQNVICSTLHVICYVFWSAQDRGSEAEDRRRGGWAAAPETGSGAPPARRCARSSRRPNLESQMASNNRPLYLEVAHN